MTTRFSCDYAKRLAACKKCKLQIAKGDLRLAKVTPNPFVQKAEGPPPDMKQYFHPLCLFEGFMKARATTKVIEEPGDIEGWDTISDEDKGKLSEMIDDLLKVRSGSGKETPSKPTKKRVGVEHQGTSKTSPPKKVVVDAASKERDSSSLTEKMPDEASKFNSFYKFCKLCDVIASVAKHSDKSECVRRYLNMDGYDGDTLCILRFLLPGIDQRVYNLKEKQLIRHFAQIYDVAADDLMEMYNQSGDVSKVIKEVSEKQNRIKKSDWSIQKIDRWLNKLTAKTRDDEQVEHLRFVAKRLSPLELLYLLRIIKKDMRFTAGAKHILDGLHPSAYEAFQSCRDLADIVARASEGSLAQGEDFKIGIRLGTPVLPMLAEACKSVEYAMDKCPNGMCAEIKYDGERVQLHKKGSNFNFFSRSLKPVQQHKISQVDEVIAQAFPDCTDLIVDAEVLMVDTNSGKPLPFGSLGVHKRENFRSAVVCLYIFDCLLYNDQNLMNTPLRERKEFLKKTLKEVPNRIMHSNYQIIKNGEHHTLKTMILKAIDEGLEGLVLKDLESFYEPGKRHWLKVKKDYLEQGSMADTADLIVLGAYFGTGSKGGMMSVFLMGVYDAPTKSYRTVTKCGNGFTDAQLDQLNKELELKMKRIGRDATALPKWLRCSRQLCPDFIIEVPEEAPIWEITGAEFTRSDNHSADGISIRFPRVTRIREDKNRDSATSLKELRHLFETSKERSDVVCDAADQVPLYTKDEQALGGSLHESVDKPLTSEQSNGQSHKRTRQETNQEASGTATQEKRLKKDVKEKEDETNGGKPACKYGKSCYRKNPEHKEEFWHPTT